MTNLAYIFFAKWADDDNGNMLTGYDFTNPDQVAQRTITWNADNMPTTVIRQAGGSTVTTHFDYDGQGRRAIKSTGGNTTYYVSREFEVINGASTMYIYAGNLRVAKVSGGAIYNFHKDHLGSSTVMTDAAGTAVEGNEYMPFGSQREHLGSDISDYKFTDQELDATTGFYNYNARLYDPVIGRFVSADPFLSPNIALNLFRAYDLNQSQLEIFLYNPQNLNRYSYCINNPLRYTDPNGLVWNHPEDAPDIFGLNGATGLLGGVLGAGTPIMSSLESLPNMHQTAYFHDIWCESTQTNIRPIDTVNLIGSMVPCFVAAFGFNVLTTVIDFLFDTELNTALNYNQPAFEGVNEGDYDANDWGGMSKEEHDSFHM